jgi:DNA polymerase-3 subunit alpha
MRSLLRLMRPDNFEDISAVGALYRPGPMGCQLAHQLRAAQERQQDDHPDPPRAREAR